MVEKQQSLPSSPHDLFTDDPGASTLKRAGPSGAPPVWADTRQELAESLQYYRAYQSGSYIVGPCARDADLTQRGRNPQQSHVRKDFLPYAYLLGGFGSRRDAWAAGGKVVISHGGGHAAHLSSQATRTNTTEPASVHHLQLTSSQTRRDPRVAALISSHQTGTPCILILGEDYALTDFHLNCGFAVLGWYAITACWAERENQSMVRWKVRFQWLDHQGTPWWLPNSTTDLPLPWNPRIRKEIVGQTPCEADSSATKLQMKRAHCEKDLRDRLAKRTKRTANPTCQSTGTAPAASSGHSFSPQHWLERTPAEGKKVCQWCHSSSPQVYQQGWTCLTPECNAGFWKFRNRSTRRSKRCNLTLEERFVTPFPAQELCDIALPFSIQPSSQCASGRTGNKMTGLFCHHCHRLSCREDLASHRCAHCGYQPALAAQTPISTGSALPLVPAPSSNTTHQALSLLDDVFINPRFNIQATRRLVGPFEVMTYEFPAAFLGSKLHLVRLLPTPREEDTEREKTPPLCDAAADNVLAGMKKQNVPLRRHELTMHRSCASGSKARLLTQMFTCNVGAAYKHSTATETQLMSEAPECILQAGALLSERTKLVGAHLPDNQDFNELYPCAYVAGMKMNYHDDGEPGLAPVVSSLSLGDVSARMNFRLKKKFVSQREQPQTSNEQHAAPSNFSSQTILQAYRRQQRLAVQNTLRIPTHDRLAISLPLRHGYVVVQEGKALQECLEHAVYPNWDGNCRQDGMRYAVTARRIDAQANRTPDTSIRLNKTGQQKVKVEGAQ